MASYLITGASRGIGLELTKQLLALPSSKVSKVFAVSRSDSSPPLRDLVSKSSGRLVHILASVDDTASVQKAAEEVQTHVGSQGLDVLINNAGINGVYPQGMKSVPPEDLAQHFDVNVIGPQRVITAFLPLLEAGRQKKVISISTAMGSISWAKHFSFAPTPAYKISKTALNRLNMQYALDYADVGFTFLCVSPGWLKTDMGGAEFAHLDVHTGVAAVVKIVLAADSSQNGKFMNIDAPGYDKQPALYDGGEIAW